MRGVPRSGRRAALFAGCCVMSHCDRTGARRPRSRSWGQAALSRAEEALDPVGEPRRGYATAWTTTMRWETPARREPLARSGRSRFEHFETAPVRMTKRRAEGERRDSNPRPPGPQHGAAFQWSPVASGERALLRDYGVNRPVWFQWLPGCCVTTLLSPGGPLRACRLTPRFWFRAGCGRIAPQVRPLLREGR